MGALARHVTAFVACLALAACGTILAIDPDAPVNGDAGTRDAASEGATQLDGSEITLDFDAAGDDASTACGLSLDRSVLGMGDVLSGSSHTETVNIGNVTDMPATVSVVATGAGFSLNGPTTTAMVAVPASTPKTPFQVTFSAGGTPGPAAGALTLTWSGGCLLTIPLSGTSVAAGSVAVSPSTVDLGAVTCGSAPPQATLHVQSVSNTTWSGSIVPAGTPFSVPASGTISAGETLIGISSTPLVPREDPKRFDAMFQFTIAGQTQRNIAVTALSLGAKLDFLPSNDITLTKTAPTRNLGLRNTGTQAVQVALSVAAPLTISPAKVTVLVGQTQVVTVSASGTFDGTAAQTPKISAIAGTVCSGQTLTVRY
jgi:hypothetical protein